MLLKTGRRLVSTVRSLALVISKGGDALTTSGLDNGYCEHGSKLLELLIRLAM